MDRPAKLFNRHFLLLWQGQFVSNLGNQMFVIAMIFWVKEVSQSASLVGMLLLVSGLPAIFFGPIGGAFADRYSRRTIIIICDLLSGIAMLLVAGAMFLMPGATTILLAWMFLVTIFVATFGAFFQPAIDAAIPDLVPPQKVSSANSLNELSVNLSTFIGQGLGGMLFRILGAPALLLLNGVSFLFSATSELFITIPQHLPESTSGWRERLRAFKEDIIAGLRYIWDVPGLRKFVLIMALFNFMGMPIIVLLPFFVEDTLGLSADWYGFFIAAFSVGMLIGYLLAGTLNATGLRRSRLILAGILLEGITYLLIVLVGTQWGTLALAPIAGLMNGFLAVNFTTILQIVTPGEMRGRVFGLMGTILGSISPIAAGLAGLAADLLGKNIPLIYLICSGSIILLALGIIFSRDIRTFLAQDEAIADDAELQGQAVMLN